MNEIVDKQISTDSEDRNSGLYFKLIEMFYTERDKGVPWGVPVLAGIEDGTEVSRLILDIKDVSVPGMSGSKKEELVVVGYNDRDEFIGFAWFGSLPSDNRATHGFLDMLEGVV